MPARGRVPRRQRDHRHASVRRHRVTLTQAEGVSPAVWALLASGLRVSTQECASPRPPTTFFTASLLGPGLPAVSALLGAVALAHSRVPCHICNTQQLLLMYVCGLKCMQ